MMGSLASMATVNYVEVVCDLRARASKLLDAAATLEGFMGAQELAALGAQQQLAAATPVAAPASTSSRPTKTPGAVPQKKRKPRNFEEFLERKKARTAVPSNLPTLISAVEAAVTEGPKTPRELTARVLELRPGSDAREVSKTAFTLKKRGSIEKHFDDGRWYIASEQGGSEETETKVKATHVPTKHVPTNRVQTKPAQAPATPGATLSIRDLIRQAIAEDKNRTAYEIAERVQHFRPDLPAANITTQISQLVIAGEARQTAGGLIVPAANLKAPAMNGTGMTGAAMTGVAVSGAAQ